MKKKRQKTYCAGLEHERATQWNMGQRRPGSELEVSMQPDSQSVVGMPHQSTQQMVLWVELTVRVSSADS